MDYSSRVGRIRRILCSTPTDDSLKARSRFQMYVYAAKRAISGAAAALGYHALAEALKHQAFALRERFQKAF